MGYIALEPQAFINIKLTDVGRRMLSLGQLTFTSAVFSDREIDYDIDRLGNYDIANNRILSPVDAHPTFSNFDGTDPVLLTGNQVTSGKQFATATTITSGFFTGQTNAFAIDNTKYKGKAALLYSTFLPNGGTSITTLSGYTPQVGDIMYAPWEPIQNSGDTFSSGTDIIQSGNPTVALWYRVAAVNSATNFTVDRPTPNFGTLAPAGQGIGVYFFPGGSDAVEMFYGSAATTDVSVWNLSIVRTNSVEGTLGISGYTSYGSIEYNGTKHYLGFSAETPIIGFVHFSNSSTANTYAEQLIEQSVVITLPTVMWHNIGTDNGQGKYFGLTLYDVDGDTIFDTVSQTTYRFLKDSVSSSGNIVGRVYHKLKLIVITDPELLTALTYKSNRNYTLPQLNLTLTPTPKYPLSNSQATGLCQSGYTYFVTYIPENFSAYTSGVTFGYAPALHCAYISAIDGQTDVNGNPQFLNASFPAQSFPYLRSSVNMNPGSAFSGTGWNANSVQLLINVQPTIAGYSIGNLPPSGWQRISASAGNGIYTGDTTDLTIDPLKLAGFNFNVSQQDYNSGSTYVLNNAITTGNDRSSTGLTFGDESFIFGNIDTNIMSTTFKSVITCFAKNADFNSSDNSSFDSLLDDNTYITEIGVLDNVGNLVAVGKPTFPINKSERRFLAFQLEIDF